MNAIVYSVWKCLGDWYGNAWGMANGKFLFIAHYKGQYYCHGTESSATEKANRHIAMIRAQHPETVNFPAISEQSIAWQAYCKSLEKA